MHSFSNFPSYTANQRTIKHCLLTYTGKNMVPHNRLVKRSLIIDNSIYFKEGIIHEDNLWVFYLAKHVMSMAYCPNPTYNHRYNPDSITGNVNIPKATLAYKTIITESSADIDPLLPGHQKEVILYTLLTALQAHYYDNEKDKNALIQTFTKQNSFLERVILCIYMKVTQKFLKTKLLHLLIRLYKIND